MRLAVDRGSAAARAGVVGRRRGCFQTSGGAREAFGVVWAGSTIAADDDDGDGPYERQMAVDKVQRLVQGTQSRQALFP